MKRKHYDRDMKGSISEEGAYSRDCKVVSSPGPDLLIMMLSYHCMISAVV